MDIKFKDRLSYRQAKHTVIVALMLGIILSMVQIFYEFIVEKRAMDSTVSQVVGMLKESATMAAYNLDAQQAQNVLRGLFGYQAIRKATIANEYNEILGNKERPITQGPLNAIVNLFFGPETRLTYPLYYEKGLSVGSLSVTIDHYFAAQRWLSKAGVVIITGVVRNFILAIILTLIFYYSLTLPLLRLIRSIAAVDPHAPAGMLLEIPRTHQKNEMGLLIGTLNGLLQSFATSLEEREAAEANLAQSEQKYRGIFENSSEGIFQSTKEGRLQTANSTLARILRFESPQELLMTLTDLRKVYVDPGDRERLLARIEAEGNIKDFQTHLFRKDRTTVPVSMNIHVVKDADGNLLYLEGNLEDISEKLRTEKLRIEKEAAEAANSAKSEFLANMSHEIRTPMNGIIGNTALAMETDLTRDQYEYLQAIHISADHLMGVINDILDFSKIEAGRLDLEQIDFTLRKTLEDAVETLAVKAHDKGLELVSHVDTEIPDDLAGDPGRLRQIIVNLLGNAIKFTETGEVVVACKMESQQDAEVWLHFSVSDTGIGIAAEKLETVFDSFQQADSSTTRKYGGTGLGLTICKQLVELMGGRIWVQSPREGLQESESEGAAFPGSTFHFTVRFELQPDQEKLVPQYRAVDIRNKRVLILDDNTTNLSLSNRHQGRTHPSRKLVVTQHTVIEERRRRRLNILLAEDNPINQKMAVHMLTKMGHSVFVADNGRKAIELLQKKPVDMVLMDVQMPEMDGLTATRLIRGKETKLRNIPIIAMTAYAMKGDREKCLKAGMDDYISKPFHPQHLNELIARWDLNHPRTDMNPGKITHARKML